MTKRPTSPPPVAELRRLINGYWHTQMVYVAAKLGLADLLGGGPKSAPELAALTDAHPRSLYRLLRGLASLGVFAEDAEGRFGLTPLAELLRAGVPDSQRAAAVMMGEERYLAWGELLHSVRTGGNAFRHRFGEPMFEYTAARPEAARVFDEAMTSIHGAETRAMLEAYRFPEAGLVVDVGGGNGSTLAEVLAAYPELYGIVLDRPDVAERANQRIAELGLGGRCRVAGRDFFAGVPEGGDVYLLRHILHDWDDERCGQILASCRRAMGPGARLLAVECVLAPGNEPDFGKLQDLNMLVVPGGMERTEAEFRQLFEVTGFRLNKVVPTSQGVKILEGTPAP